MEINQWENKKQYNIIIWGGGNTARDALKHVSDTVNILGFFDNNLDIKKFEGLYALDQTKIADYEFDYIVICSIYHIEISRQLDRMGVPSEKVLVYNFQKCMSYFIYKLNPFETKWNKLLEQKKPEIFISGISYQNDGINDQMFEREISKGAFNFALRGQDIFYDYQIAKLLDNKGYLEKVTHYIIGLCYYSFEYDLSKSVNAWEIIRYYPYIKEQHNFATACPFEEFVKEAKKYLDKNEIYYNLFNKRESYVLNDDEGKKVAKADFNKNHPVMVWENKNILKQFLKFLNERKIKPIIVIMPAIKGYVQTCSVELKERFYNNLSECIEGMNIQILDYLGSYYGSISDYYHATHFNKTGAVKFTEKLIQDIQW